MTQAVRVFGPTVAMLVPGLVVYLFVLVWQGLERLRSHGK